MSSYDNSKSGPSNQAPQHHIPDEYVQGSFDVPRNAHDLEITQHLERLIMRDSNRQPVPPNPSHRVSPISSNDSSPGNVVSSGSGSSPRWANSADWRARNNTAEAHSNTSPQHLMPNPSGGGIGYNAGTETRTNASNTAQADPRVRPQRKRSNQRTAPARSEQHCGHQTRAQASTSNLPQVAPHAPLRASPSFEQNHGSQARIRASPSNSTQLAPQAALRAAPDLRPNHGLQAGPSHPVVSNPLAPSRMPVLPQLSHSNAPLGNFQTRRHSPTRGPAVQQFQGEPVTVCWTANGQPVWVPFASIGSQVALNTTTTTTSSTTTDNHQGSGSTGHGQPTPVNHNVAMPWAGQILPRGTPAIVRTVPSTSGHVASTNVTSVPNAPRHSQNGNGFVTSNVGLHDPANGGLQAPTNLGLQVPANVGLQAPANVGLQVPANGGGLFPGNGGRGSHSSNVFRPMNAVWRKPVDPNNDAQRELKVRAGISLNYAGDATIPDNKSADIPNRENCSFWVTNLPPDLTYGMLLASIRGMGRIYCTHINPPDYSKGHETAAAKIVFFDIVAAHRFYATASDPSRGFVVNGMRAKVSLNRIKVAARDEGGNQSRVLIIKGAWKGFDRESLEEWFSNRFQYDVDKVVYQAYSTEFKEIEFHFASFRCQAQAAHLALTKEGAGRAGSQIWSFRYGVDPCSQN